MNIDYKSRNKSIDALRGIAIIAVMLYHFNYYVYMGTLGVDLFFVISGFLVGGLLLRDFNNKKKIDYWNFILRRGFKIWPSYYFFLTLAGIIAYIIFSKSNPEYLPNNWFKYIFFYQNYSKDLMSTNEWIFAHAWSLCVEEHFYLLLPLIFVLVQRFFSRRVLFFALFAIIGLSFLSKYYSFFYTQNQDTYFTTHSRLDALAWGVLLNFVTIYKDFFRKMKYKLLVLLIAVTAFFILVKLYFFGGLFFQKVIFRSVIPIVFCVVIGVSYYLNIKIKPLQLVGIYSYNLYLWHPIISAITGEAIGYSWPGLIVYLATSLFIAVLFTRLIEIPFLNYRNKYFNKGRMQHAPAPTS
jgi:peptidoglycan/LPS O-acetylase OafA/YrhL